MYVVVEGTAETAPDAVARVETKVKAGSAALKGFGSRLEVDPPIAYAVGATPAPNGYIGAATPASNLARSVIRVQLIRPDTPMGDQLIGMAAAWGDTCTPTVWVDGDLVVHPAGPSAGALLVSPSAQAAAAAGRAQSTTQATAKGGTVVAGLSPTQAAGLAELSWLVMPSDIEGVEIYRRPMEIPAQFVVGGYAGCGAIVIWTRWRTALPQTTPPPSGAPHDRN